MRSSKNKKKRISSLYDKTDPLAKILPSKIIDPYATIRTSNHKKSTKSHVKSIQPTNRSRMHTSNY